MDDGQKTVLDAYRDMKQQVGEVCQLIAVRLQSWFAAANQRQQRQPQKSSVPAPQKQQPMESVSTPQPPIQPQERPHQPQKEVSVTPQTLQQQQQSQQVVSVSPPQAQAQRQVKKVSDAPPKTEPQPQQQPETQANPSVREKGTIPSGVVNLPTPEEEAAILYRAFTGRGCDVGRLLRVFKQRDATHRRLIHQQYRKNYGEELSDRIKSSGGVVPPTTTPEEDAAVLYRAFKGSGCDVGWLVQILSKCDPKHRHQIAQHFRKNYGEELSDLISAELSTLGRGFLRKKVGFYLIIKAMESLGWLWKDIKRAISLWLLSESERDATIVWQSLQLMSLDKAALTEVICSRTPSQIRNLKLAYFIYFKSELSKDISSSTLLRNTDAKELLVACLDDKAREEGTNVDVKKAEEDAKQLFKDGKIWGTNKKTFIDIFTKRNRPHLAAVDAAYNKLYGLSLEEAVRREISPGFMAELLTLLKCAKNPAKYFAEVLYNSARGLGTSDTTLVRVVVTRAGIDMEDIKKEYVQAYKTSLKDYIHNDTSGEYRAFLLNLIE